MPSLREGVYDKMRTLKFRFWLGDTMQGILELEQGGIIDMAWKWDKVDQFTGLLDRHGQEIYEGDVVRKYGSISMNDPAYGLYEPIFTMVWNDDAACFGLALDKPNTTEIPLFLELEVIGNIYENPELVR